MYLKATKMTDISQAQAECKAKSRRDSLCFLAQNPAVFVKTDYIFDFPDSISYLIPCFIDPVLHHPVHKEIIKELFDIGFGLYEKGAKCNYQQGAENAFMYGYLLGVQSQKANS